MEEDKLIKLFADFQPELESDTLFLSRLEKQMGAIEVVREHNLKFRKRNRMAVVAAAIAGFVTGVIFMLVLPYISAWLTTVTFTIPYFSLPAITINFEYLSWGVMAILSVAAAVGAYELTRQPICVTRRR